MMISTWLKFNGLLKIQSGFTDFSITICNANAAKSDLGQIIFHQRCYGAMEYDHTLTVIYKGKMQNSNAYHVPNLVFYQFSTCNVSAFVLHFCVLDYSYHNKRNKLYNL